MRMSSNVGCPTQSGDGGSTPARSLQYQPIDKKVAIALIIKHHYLHRRCPISWAFGIIRDGEIVGVLTIGKPNSWSLCCGAVRETKAKLNHGRNQDVYELNRLWLDDSLPRNSESHFIGWVLRRLRKERPNLILVSYADSGQGHIGTVYQASGWMYTGFNKPWKDITLAGFSNYKSPAKRAIQGEKINGRYAWGSNPDAVRVPRSRKHRYVWCANKTDYSLIAWTRQPYPSV